ncbi:LPS export ABC transporter ATP-binding protein [Gammaproteobacteria bacterium]|jgi:lipopolysaccharide export system ATP-binding protein|nr:LPS export ABC transporter ATP-binding protein [Gammaproteobacteria bacterium]MDA7709339.1 LPS export ABC transporter ATP-binding protein [Gammaproteobacteria bacterium]MDA7800188.1 LPS export ABC transporter ATP-binding protein [Gammaproteobacteria bacterium]MDA8674236.1 LPS export ABC transporter ATP-binding protein [Gammaproteobacteria bacterium]MDA8808988.1 LPS export ABC transporter ATP-binding protein [Gammaproteobacteria bacterium]|tara:strand:- start:12275 stop:12988 length:714 start_codon:yes stop_codon:yes gene_type:complete
MLTLNEISKSIKDKTIVNKVSFEIKPGSVNGLLGPNGAGKTTTFYLIAGLIKLDSGEIIFNGHDISNMPMHKRSNMGIKYLPQEPSIFQDLTVYENLYGLAEISFKEKSKISQFMTQSIEEFSLEKILDLKGRQLSGGQRRKVEIARTLAASPKMILLDEPFAGIDPIAIDEIKNVLRTLKEKGIAILITDHNVREALDICDNAIVVNRGQVIAKGVKADLINNDLVKKVYLGNMYS